MSVFPACPCKQCKDHSARAHFMRARDPGVTDERVAFEAGQFEAELVARIAELEQALKFYANNDSWLSTIDSQFGETIVGGDLEKDSPITKRKWVGGKRAREALQVEHG